MSKNESFKILGMLSYSMRCYIFISYHFRAVVAQDLSFMVTLVILPRERNMRYSRCQASVEQASSSSQRPRCISNLVQLTNSCDQIHGNLKTEVPFVSGFGMSHLGNQSLIFNLSLGRTLSNLWLEFQEFNSKGLHGLNLDTKLKCGIFY